MKLTVLDGDSRQIVLVLIYIIGPCYYLTVAQGEKINKKT
jgi:hypothetical protein